MSRILIALVLSSGALTGAIASPIEWALLPPACSGGNADLVVECGGHGRFLFGDPSLPVACDGVVGNTESGRPYPARHADEPFSGTAPLLQNAIGILDLADWVSVIDVDGPHGDSVTWMVNELLDDAASAYLTRLIGGDLGALGSTATDFHLVSRLCGLVEAVDDDDTNAPVAVNMSFGRAVDPLDPDSSNCARNEIACQVALVVERLANYGTTLVAASGNQREMLFPASLDRVLSSTLADGNYLRAWTSRLPAWESPPTGHDAVFPGQSLCLNDWSASSGSSYSAAWATALLTREIVSSGLTPPPDGGVYSLGFDTERSCWSLELDLQPAGACSEPSRALVDGMRGRFASECWNRSAPVLEPTGQVQWGVQRPGVPGFARYMQRFVTAPESDPCVPCVGEEDTNDPDTTEVDTSETGSLPSNVRVDGVFLNLNNNFYYFLFTRAQLDAIATGQINVLRFPGSWSALNSSVQQPSIWFLLTTQPPDCMVNAAQCYWISTPISLP